MVEREAGSATERSSWLGTTAVGLLAAGMVLPFGLMIAISDDYPGALTTLPFGQYFLNSVVLAGSAAVGQVLTSAAAAYAFARLRFSGRDRVFLAFLAVLLAPAVVLIVPRFFIINELGWVDTYAGLVSTGLVSVWGIFLLRQCFLTIPRDLEDAARLDGAGEWTIFWRVVLPLSKPALATLAVLAFVDQWKTFLWPLVATRSPRMQVVELGVASLHGLDPADWPHLMAAAVTATLPPIVVFLLAQRHFIQDRQLTGLS